MQSVFVVFLLLAIAALPAVYLIKKKKTTGSCTGCPCAGKCSHSCAQNHAEITTN